MTHLVSVLALAGLLAAGVPVAAEPGAAPPALETRVDATVSHYADALKTGNCRELERHLAPTAYETYRTLCEQNAEYPQFLRTFYRDASFWVSDIRVDGAEMRCTLHVHTPDGDASQASLRLERHGARKWRITRIDS